MPARRASDTPAKSYYPAPFYTASNSAINGGLNLVADGLDGIAVGLEWAQKNLPNTMSLVERASSIIDPTRGVDSPLVSNDCVDCI